jgi:glucose-1-phosphate adenylyltransferase
MAPRGERFVSRLTRDTLALIMAGGRGDRLKDLTRWRAKPAVPFGGKFRIIDFPLSNCVNSGIRRISVLTQYKAHSLIRHLQRGWSFLHGEFGEFVEILPASQRIDTAWYAGTADSIYQNLDILRVHNPRFVLVLAGDHVYKMDYGPMLAFHVDNKADVTIGCIEVPLAEASQFGVLAADSEFGITEFEEKPEQPKAIPGRPGAALASMGIYFFNKDFLFEQLICDHDDPKSSHDFGKDVIPSVIGKYRVFAYAFRGTGSGADTYWRDVGTVDAYWKANMEMVSVVPDLNLYDKEWPVFTYQEQLPPAKFVFDYDGQRGMALDSMVSGGCIVAGALVRRSLLFSNVKVEVKSVITDSVVLPDVTISPNCRISRAVIDKSCVIPPNTVIGERVEDDAKRFHVTSGGIVLVTPEMLGQQIHQVR